MPKPGGGSIEETCAAHDREIEPDHYGVLIPYANGPVPDETLATLAKRRPDLDPRSLIPTSWEALAERIRGFVDVGTSKFVVLPLTEPVDEAEWTAHLEQAAAELLPLET